MKQLYPHQVDAVTKVREAFAKGYKKVCLQAPTGMGKTVVAIHIISQAIAKGKNVLFLVHVKELIEQTASAATEEGLQYSYIAADYPFDKRKQFQIASTQTLVRRLGKLSWKPDVIVYDEAHHSPAETSLKILNYYHDVPVIGLTATPQRLDGKGLDKVFDNLVVTISTKQLIEKGFLSQYEYYAPESGINFDAVHTLAGDYNPHEMEAEIDKTQIFGKAVENYKRYIDGEPAICFALNIKHSIKLVNEFKAAGVSAVHMDSKMPKSERDKAVTDFKEGRIKVLSNVNLATEGFDMPACTGVFIVRPTKSETLFLQMVGRGLRKAGNKICKIFDHVENYKEHGLPDEERDWSLQGHDKKVGKPKQKQRNYVTCSNCSFTYIPKLRRVCPKCGNQEQINTKEVEHVSGVLQQITEYSRKNSFTKEQIKLMKRQCKTIDEYKALAKQLNYKPGWAIMQFELRKKWLQRFTK